MKSRSHVDITLWEKKPVLLCAADLAHLPAVKELLESTFEVRWARPATPDNLASLLPEADAYFAALEVRLTEELISLASRLRAIATPSTGLDHLDLTATAARDIAVWEGCWRGYWWTNE